MTVAVGNWLDTVDFANDFPNEPLVQVAIHRESPFLSARRSAGTDSCAVFYGEQRHGSVSLAQLESTTDAALVDAGPEAANKVWRDAFKLFSETASIGEPVSLRRYWEGHWSTLGRVPNMIGASPVAAALYLAAIGKSNRHVPISFARALLDPEFEFPERLAELPAARAAPVTVLKRLDIDGEHRLVLIDQDILYLSDGRRYVDRKAEVQAVIAEGWRRRNSSIVLGAPAEKVDPDFRRGAKWQFDHDGTRLVRLDNTPGREVPTTVLPIVELSGILSDITTLADAVTAVPTAMLDPATRAKHWVERFPTISGVAVRIVEAILLEFVPWPHPFRRRSEAEQRLRPQESNDAVVALFDRLLDAPGPIRPADLTAYFYSLITKRRAEFSAWPEELAGVWGFKIKTGDHNWIEGRIWHEPNGTDNPSDPVECDESASLIEQGRYRNRYRHRVSLKTGTLRCYIQRDDT